MWRAILAELDAAGRLDTSELAIDATFAESRKGGNFIGPTKCRLASKIEVVVDAHGIPLAYAMDAANVSETALGLAALAMLAVMLPGLDWSPETPTPVLANKA